MADKKVGTITHYYGGLSVGIVTLTDALKIGDKVRVEGATTNFEQDISEMQFEHKSIDEATKGQEVGIKVKDKVREGDEVFIL
jgi:putative protease